MTSLGRLSRLAAFMVPVLVLAGCERPDADDSDGGPTLATTADTIAFGRDLIVHHGCGDCHGGGDNPAAPVWLSGYRHPNDSLFTLFKIYVPDGTMFLTRPRNLTPDNETGTGRFSERQIFNALRYGLRPGETPDVDITSSTPGQGNFPENPKYLAPPMPWPAFRHMTDTDLKSMAAYIKRGLKPQTNKVEPSEGPPDFWAGLYMQFYGASVMTPAFPTAQETAQPPQ